MSDNEFEDDIVFARFVKYMGLALINEKINYEKHSKFICNKEMQLNFNNFINSGNTSCFDISTIETFYTGAMEAHNKSLVVEFANDLKESHPEKMKINIEEI